jgi:CIC family chloride channel protein
MSEFPQTNGQSFSTHNNNSRFYRFLLWREKHIRERTFVLIVSLLVGILTGVAAIALKQIIHWIHHGLTANFDLEGGNYLFLVYPLAGTLLAGVFVRYCVRDDIGHGITKVLYALSLNKSRIKPHNTWSSLLASSVTIGFGGSVGAEAPIVLTGSAIGSNLGRFFRMEQRTLMLLIGCGAAGAIAGIFKAPIAGLMFVIEVLLLDLTLSSIVPLLITATTATTVSYFFTGTEALFPFRQTEGLSLERIPYILALGVACGLFALYFTRMTNYMEGVYRRIGSSPLRFVIGGVLLSTLIFLFPPLYGEGYETITDLLNGQLIYITEQSIFHGLNDSTWGIILFLALVMFVKLFASTATNALGGCGGTFAPSLFVGCITGFIFAHTLNQLDFHVWLPEKNFALLGMAGMLSAVMHAPLTGVFFIAELTGGFELFLPLMIVSVGAYLTIIIFEPHSIHSYRLAQKGELLTHHKDKAVLTLLDRNAVIERDFIPVHPEMFLGDIVKIVARSTRNVYPVLDDEDKLLGIIRLDNIRNIIFRPELYKRFKVSKFMVSGQAVLRYNMPMEKIMHIFDETKAWNLPVVDENGRYLGFMSKSRIFDSYREILVENYSGD